MATGKAIVVIEVLGGIVQEAYCDGPVELVLVDWDTEGCDLADERIIQTAEGSYAFVEELPLAAIDDIRGTDAEMALKAAGIDLPGDHSGMSSGD